MLGGSGQVKLVILIRGRIVGRARSDWRQTGASRWFVAAAAAAKFMVDQSRQLIAVISWRIVDRMGPIVVPIGIIRLLQVIMGV